MAVGHLPHGLLRAEDGPDRVDCEDALHPRLDPDGARGLHVPTCLAADVLAFVRECGLTHRRDLKARFGRKRAVNGWGGFSKATTRAQESLQHYGLLRVAQQRDGIRLYANARFLAPFDPLVWDRRSFEHFWDWAYRFEAYMPPPRRQFGYYAMPLLWGDTVIGWANVVLAEGEL